MDFFLTAENPIHAEYNQLKQQKNALKLKSDSIDFDKHTAKIGKCKVTLGKCTCFEFQKSHKPCKHMYRLAFELGIFELDAEKIELAMKTAPKRSLYGCKSSFLSSVPKNFIVIDFENANRLNDSICQIGIAVVKNNSVIELREFWIRPPYKEFTATKIHGITFDDVKNAPNFKEAWTQIKKYFEEKTIAAYALPHDLIYFFATLSRYNIPRPNFKAFDVQDNICSILKKYSSLAELENLQLVTIAKKLGLNHNSHDALSDALVTAKIQIYLSKYFPAEKTKIYLSTSAVKNS